MNNIYNAGPWITYQDKEYVMDAMHCWYGKDRYKYCELFEEDFAKLHERKYGIATTNCTSAIHLCLLVHGVGPGDEVIVPEITWIGSSAGIDYCAADTTFADVNKGDWCLNIKSVENLIRNNTMAIIAVNIYGNICDFNELEKICHKEGILLIEDAAESLGSTLNKRKSGSFGDMSVFSFHVSKTLVMGEGGIILTDNPIIAKDLKMLRDHGRYPETKPYYNEMITPKYTPSNIQCALGYGQLQRLDELINRKREIFHIYKNILKDLDGVALNRDDETVYNGAWATNIVWDERYKINKQEMLEKTDIAARPMFYPLSSIPAYNRKGNKNFKDWIKKTNNIAYDITNRGITLPCALNMTDNQVEYCGLKVKEVLNESRI